MTMGHDGPAETVRQVLEALEDETAARRGDFQDQVLAFAGDLARRGMHGDALEILVRLSRVLPDRAETWSRMGVLLTALNRPEDAEASLQHALSCDPCCPEAYLYLAELYKAQKKDREANDCLRTFLGLHKKREGCRESRVHTNLGWLHCVKGNADEALHHFREALEKGVENPQTFLDLRLASRHLKGKGVPDSSEFTSRMERLETSIREEAGRLR